MARKNPFLKLSKFEYALWGLSLVGVTLSFVLSGGNLLSLAASLIGVTALIFVAKGMVLGQMLTVLFAVFYGIASCHFRYWGEVITYLGVTAPIAICSTVSWIKHPYRDSGEVTVHRMGRRELWHMLALSLLVTASFFFILRALGTASLPISTLSITTSFIASYLTWKRSELYALAYAANDIVLIVLWLLAAIQDISFAPMVMCFVLFLANDIYGFINWQRMRTRQKR